MMRVILHQLKYPSSNRKQNFFQVNPIYPDYGQKDFDIYNVQRKRVAVFDKFTPIKKREKQLKSLIKDQFFLRKYKIRQMQKSNVGSSIDQISGLPLGLNANYDAFISQYRKKKSDNVKLQNQFKQLMIRLIKKFKVKSQVQLIKIFRISMAHSKKGQFKDKIRSKLIQQAVTSASNKNNSYFGDFFNSEKDNLNQQTSTKMNQTQLDETAFRQALEALDKKIQSIQSQLIDRKTRLGLDEWDSVYGRKIKQRSQQNPKYDINLKRGYSNRTQSKFSRSILSQDEQILRRLNKLFFMRKLQYIKNQSQFSFSDKDLPIHLLNKQKIINQLAHKYKQEDMMIEPDLKEIYSEIDMVLDKVKIRIMKQKETDVQHDQEAKVQDWKMDTHDLIWDTLDVEKVFASDYYSKQSVDQEVISDKALLYVSPSAGTQLSLNRLGLNLYRHSQCQVFNVFTKYKHMILKDYLKDVTIDPVGQFNYFSLEQASNILRRLKKQPQSQGQKYYGTARRKKSQAQVYLKHGTGVVTVNGQSIADYWADTYYRVQALKPLMFSETAGKYDIQFNVVGGGLHGQSECCAYALAFALMKVNPEFRKIFENIALDKADTRRKEPKRIGLYSARVRPPFVRR